MIRIAAAVLALAFANAAALADDMGKDKDKMGMEKKESMGMKKDSMKKDSMKKKPMKKKDSMGMKKDNMGMEKKDRM